MYSGLARLLEWVRHWRASEVYEEGELISSFHAKEMGWCASFFLGGRFSAWVIRDEGHLEAALMYILGNPVREKLCRTPQEWRWSGLGSPPGTDPGQSLDVSPKDTARWANAAILGRLLESGAWVTQRAR